MELDIDKYEEEKIGDFDDLHRSSYSRQIFKKAEDELEFEQQEYKITQQQNLHYTRDSASILVSENSFYHTA